MGRITKIDWCDATWNPVTGCLHGCEYCYARRIAERFGWETDAEMLHDVHLPQRNMIGNINPYPFGFAPTILRYKLDEPQHWKKPRTIFVCSMSDLFGEWVPDQWIQMIFDACLKAPQHRYVFLTKNPARYMQLLEKGIVMPNTIDWWYGYTIDGTKSVPRKAPIGRRVFASVEPIQRQPDAAMLDTITRTSWAILGAETGNRKGKVIPERGWIETIVKCCQDKLTPVFMKESLRSLMGDQFRQEFPWEV